MDKIQLKGFREGMIKEARTPGWVDYGAPAAIAGGLRSAILSEEDKEILRREYNLDENSNLPIRNSLRGFGAGVAGAALGGISGGALKGKTGIFPGAVAGTLGGTILATNKYSRGRADKIKNKQNG